MQMKENGGLYREATVTVHVTMGVLGILAVQFATCPHDTATLIN